MKEWKYEIGAKFKNSVIIDRIIELDNNNHVKNKYYKLKCLKCGSIHHKKQHRVDKQGCPYCAHVKTNVTNCIATTDPELLKFFVKINDAYLYSRNSTKYIDFKCPNCGYIKNMKLTCFINSGFCCPICNNTNSKGERIFAKLLLKNNIQFIKEFTPKWSNKKRYDFYLPEFNMIVEINGYQHYKNTYYGTYEKQLNNDKYKYDLAVLNGFEYNKNYFVINYETDDSFIRDLQKLNLFTIEDNELLYFNFESNPLIKFVCDEYNKERLDIKDLSNKLNISVPTISKYLNLGNKLGYCNYDYKKHIARAAKKRDYKENKKSISAYKNGIFICRMNSINEMADNSFELFGVYMRADSISRAIRTNKEYKGIKFVFTKGDD